ncbi:glycine cleavage system protein T [Bryobacterales bacterium F-183]|nr:glycine cleavage system protein T [Bryobacterales bacterium F-183]
MTGYNELRNSAAWIDLSSRGKIRVTGEDRARLLHAMTTNQVQGVEPGTASYGFFLSAQGRILADVWIVFRPDDLILITEPETRQKVYDHLDQYIIADDAYLEDVTDQLALISIEGPTAGTLELPITATGLPGGSVLMDAGAKPAFVGELGLCEADAEAVRTVRLETAKPRYGEEISERFLVQETGQMQAVSFTKGCYLGQEIVERVRSRGQVHRHLRGVRIDGSEVPEAGAKLTGGVDNKEMAELVSAAYSPALDRVVGMAYVKTEAAKPDFELRLLDRVARVV